MTLFCVEGIFWTVDTIRSTFYRDLGERTDGILSVFCKTGFGFP